MRAEEIPAQPGADPNRRLFRALVVLNAIALLVILIGGPLLYVHAQDAIDQANKAIHGERQGVSENRNTICAFGRYAADTPVIRVPGIPKKQFETSLHNFRQLISDLNVRGCHLHPIAASAIHKRVAKGVVPSNTGSSGSGQPPPSGGSSGAGGGSGSPPLVHVPGVTGPGQTCITAAGTTVACRPN